MVDSVNVWKPQDELEDVGSHYSANATVEIALQEVAVLAKTPAPSGDFVGCLNKITTAATLPNGARTPIAFDGVELYDTSAIHDPAANPSRFLPPAGTTYMKVTAYIGFTISSGVTLWVSADGAVIIPITGTLIPGGNEAAYSYVSGWIDITAYTYLELVAFVTTAGATLAVSDSYISVEFK